LPFPVERDDVMLLGCSPENLVERLVTGLEAVDPPRVSRVSSEDVGFTQQQRVERETESVARVANALSCVGFVDQSHDVFGGDVASSTISPATEIDVVLGLSRTNSA